MSSVQMCCGDPHLQFKGQRAAPRSPTQCHVTVDYSTVKTVEARARHRDRDGTKTFSARDTKSPRDLAFTASNKGRNAGILTKRLACEGCDQWIGSNI